LSPFSGTCKGGEDQVDPAVAQAREAGAHRHGVAVQRAVDDKTDAQVAAEQLLLHGWVDVQVHDDGFFLQPAPIKSGHTSLPERSGSNQDIIDKNSFKCKQNCGLLILNPFSFSCHLKAL